MRSAVRRAAVVAGALAVVLGTGVGTAAASPGPPDLVSSPLSYNWGPLTVGQKVYSPFQLENYGGRPTGALTVTLTPSSGPFTILSDTCAGISLGSFKACYVIVQFAPTATGPASATLTLKSKKLPAPVTVGLSGTGV